MKKPSMETILFLVVCTGFGWTLTALALNNAQGIMSGIVILVGSVAIFNMEKLRRRGKRND